MDNTISRNFTSNSTLNDKEVFYKRLLGEEIDKKRRYHNLLLWNKICKEKKIDSPLILDQDDTTFSLYYNFLEKTIDTDKVLDSIETAERFMSKSAKLLAKIHKLKIDEYENVLEKREDVNERLLLYITPYEFAQCTGAEIELFSILQNDSELTNFYINIWPTLKKNKIYTLCHGDIRIDQFIQDKESMWIIDFEEIHLGDPTHDLAGLIGSVLFYCLLKTFSETNQDLNNQNEIDQDFMIRGSNIINTYLPIIHSIYSSYIEELDGHITIDKKLLSINIGWFMIVRIISRGKFSFRLSGLDKAILGIARNIILNPEIIIHYLNYNQGEN